MKLQDQIKEDIKQAMKGKDVETLDVLRLLKSSLQNKAIELKKELEDADVVAVIKSDVKKLQDALTQFIDAAREDLVDKTKSEIAILKKYLPAEMSDEDLEKKVREILESNEISDPSDSGRATGMVMKELAGSVDGSRVKAMIERVLN